MLATRHTAITEIPNFTAIQKLELMFLYYKLYNITPERPIKDIISRLYGNELRICLVPVRKQINLLQPYEKEFNMTSDRFYKQFNNGSIDSNSVFIEWAKLYEVFLTLEKKQRLLQVLTPKDNSAKPHSFSNQTKTDKILRLNKYFGDAYNKDLLANHDQLNAMYYNELEKLTKQITDYQNQLAIFEQKYGMLSADCYSKYEQGLLNNTAEFGEWANIFYRYIEVCRQMEKLISPLPMPNPNAVRTDVDCLALLLQYYKQNQITPDSTASQLISDMYNEEIQKYEKSIKENEAELEQYENQFNMSSVEFAEKWKNGKMGDDMIMFDWISTYDIHVRVCKRYKMLTTNEL